MWKLKVLIVDEAQDSSVIQIQWMMYDISKSNVDYFYKAGDDDQAIFAFSGADMNDLFKEPARPEIVLKKITMPSCY